MRDWYLERSELLEKEVQDLRVNGISVEDIDFSTVGQDGITLNCTIPIENSLGLILSSDLNLKIVFPSNYPYFRPEVYANDDITLPRHQNPKGKGLCLIPRPTQYWNVEEGIFAFLRERLPIVFAKGNVVDRNAIKDDPDEQAEPVSEYYTMYTNTTVFSARPNLPDAEILDMQQKTVRLVKSYAAIL